MRYGLFDYVICGRMGGAKTLDFISIFFNLFYGHAG